jgi:HTH-type transcriptional regulator, competence development regulator
MNTLGDQLRVLREKNGLLLREAAAKLQVDTGYLSKLERGEKNIRREHIVKLSQIYKAECDDLIKLWLSERVLEVVQDEPRAKEVLKMAIHKLK